MPRRMTAAIAAVFAVVAAGLALIRFRCSPVYPQFNDVNSDIYVYQVIGNSWLHGLLPYRDVYDVKGPFLYLLFGLFARLRPWSMGPPLVLLIMLAFASLWLAYAIARIRLERRSLAVLAAVMSCAVIYLSVTSAPSSFTCEELAVPGVLLLLWLMTRWLSDGDRVGAAWWVLDGLVLGALFWSKYQVIAPWPAMFVALIVIVIRGDLPARELGRVAVLHLAGVAVATAVMLSFYGPVLPDMLRAYFLAKRGNFRLATELPAEVKFVVTTLIQNTAAGLALFSVLVLLVLHTVRGARRDGLALLITYCLSLWASVAVVRHPNNLFVPLSFCAVAIPQALFVLQSRGRVVVRAGILGLATLTTAACLAPLAQSVTAYGLLRQPRPLTCYDLPTLTPNTHRGGVLTVFARTAGNQPILSPGTLFAARSSYVSHLPIGHPFEFVDASWSRTIAADQVQTRYLQDRTFQYVWIHVKGVDKFHDLDTQIAQARYTNGPSQTDQAAALVRNYIPVLGCNSEILLRAR